MTVLLIGFDERAEMDLLADGVDDLGGDVIRCDVGAWPGEAPISMTPGGDGAAFGRQIDFEAVTGCFVDTSFLFSPDDPRFTDRLQDDFVPTRNQLAEYRGLLESLIRELERRDVTVLPQFRQFSAHRQKAWQLSVLEDLGAPIPDTLFSNDPERVRTFAETRDRVIYKPVTNGSPPRTLTDADLTAERLETLATAPVQFQEHVEGEDVRVYVLDGEFVAAIRYESDADSFKLDIEADGEDAVDVEPATVPDEAVEIVVRAADALDFRFTGADLRLRPDGSFDVLELNKNPRFAAADTWAGQNVAGEIAAHLVD